MLWFNDVVKNQSILVKSIYNSVVRDSYISADRNRNILNAPDRKLAVVRVQSSSGLPRCYNTPKYSHGPLIPFMVLDRA